MLCYSSSHALMLLIQDAWQKFANCSTMFVYKYIAYHHYRCKVRPDSIVCTAVQQQLCIWQNNLSSAIW